MTPPLVSVLLPAFNAARHLRESIHSILSQSLGSLELIVVDDGSTDATRGMLEGIVDARMRVLRNPRNLGLGAALNRGLAAATGTYIARQDADDVAEPSRLAQQVSYLQRHPGIALAGTWCIVVDDDGRERRRTPLPVDDQDLCWGMYFSCPIVHGSAMWRRGLIAGSVGGYDERYSYSQDYELWTRVAARFAIGNVPAYLLRYREHEGSMTARYGARTLEGHALRVSRVAAALDWRAPEQHDTRVRAMAALLRTSQMSDLAPAAAAQAADDVLRLHEAFARQHPRVTPSFARRHRRQVRAAVGAGLLRIAARAEAQGRPADARRLVGAARRVYWRACAGRTWLRLVARSALAASKAVRA